MHDYHEDNDGRYPDESPVEVRYPGSKQEEQGDRERWPWLPGTIVEQCGPGGMVRLRRGPRAGRPARRSACTARDRQP
jgi:hypothetical protein